MNFLKKGLIYTSLIGSILGCEKKEMTPEILEEDKIEYTKNSKLISKNEINEIDSITKNKIYFSDAQEYNRGDVIIIPVSKKAPEGLLKKVVSKESKNIFNVKNATLEETIKKGRIKTKEILEPNDTTNNNLKAASLGYDFYKPFSKILYDHDKNNSTKNDQIRINGEFYFNSDLALDLVFQEKAKSAEFDFSLDARLEAQLEGNLVQNIQKEINLFDLNFSPIPLGTTGLFLTPKFNLNAGINAKFNGEFGVDFVAGGKVHSNLRYENGDWFSKDEKNLSFDISNENFCIKSNIRGNVSPELNLSINKIAGPFFELENYCQIHSNNYDWEINCGSNLLVGFDTGLLSLIIPKYEENIFSYEKNLKKGKNEKLEVDLKANVTKGKTPLNVLFHTEYSKDKKDIEKFLFDFDDGSHYEETRHSNDGEFDGKTNKTYEDRGEYYPKVAVFDKSGNRSFDTLKISATKEILLKEDDGSWETNWSYPGNCKDKYYSQFYLIEKNLEIPHKPFKLEELKILFTEKSTYKNDYTINILDGDDIVKVFTIDYADIKLDEWCTYKFENPIQIKKELTIKGTDKNYIENCDNPEIHGWGIGIDEDNKGNSFLNYTTVHHNRSMSTPRNSIDGEFMIRASGE